MYMNRMNLSVFLTFSGVRTLAFGLVILATSTGGKVDTTTVVDLVLNDGFAVMRNALPIDLIKELQETVPQLLTLRAQFAPDRGRGRYYISPPLKGPYADERLLADPEILKVVAGLVGQDAVLCQIGLDVPLGNGTSEYQTLHRDASPLFDGVEFETPPVQLAVNVPLVEIPEAVRGSIDDVGPLEIHRGSHRWLKSTQDAAIVNGSIIAGIEPVYTSLGDVIVRDVRGIHRGTPNHSLKPRPVLVLGYSKKWLRRPEVHIDVPNNYLLGASDTVKHLLRFEPVVPVLRDYTGLESYSAEVLQQSSGGSYVKEERNQCEL